MLLYSKVKSIVNSGSYTLFISANCKFYTTTNLIFV